MKKIFVGFFLSFLLISSVGMIFPVRVSAQGLTQEPFWQGIVPCARYNNDNTTSIDEKDMCTLCHLVIGIHKLFTYGVFIITSIAFLGVFLAGGLYIISSGDEGLMTQAKSFLKTALIGFAIVVGAWLIVNTTLWIIGYTQTNWYTFSCDTKN